MTRTKERIGLLFVHGIGEQKRFDHLRASVTEFAELMRQSGDGGEDFAASVVDRTADWKPAPGEWHPDGLSPITLTIESRTRELTFECCEVWWADLGARTGLADMVAFWVWAIGQWLAPIYRDLDAANLAKEQTSADDRLLNKPASRLVKLPEGVAGRFLPECRARLRLAMAALATLFVVVSWVVLKRLFSAALNTAPTPTLLVSYVGDVRTYEERAAAGDTALSDPGQPRRVGIRRRMVTEMVAMGARDDLDRWYVVAHSQGTVLAYNGLTEIGHALPNYLSEAQWDALPRGLKRDPGCKRRNADEIVDMMPARPPWLYDEDVVDRPALFAGLRGLLTYGSPLNKFAAIWPRIVATATDRKPGALPPFSADCRWVNMRALQDPVAGDVKEFFDPRRHDDRPYFDGCIPTLHNIDTPFCLDFLIAHLGYFKSGERFSDGEAMRQRRALMRWLMTGDAAAANEAIGEVGRPAGKVMRALVAMLYGGLVLLLGIMAIATVTLGGDLLQALFGTTKFAWAGFCPFAKRAIGNIVPVLAVAMTGLAGAGYIRWLGGAWLNLRLARADHARGAAAGFDRVARHFALHIAMALVILALIGAGVACNCAHLSAIPPIPGWPLALILSTASIAAGILGQALVNYIAKPLRYADWPTIAQRLRAFSACRHDDDASDARRGSGSRRSANVRRARPCAEAPDADPRPISRRGLRAHHHRHRPVAPADRQEMAERQIGHWHVATPSLWSGLTPCWLRN